MTSTLEMAIRCKNREGFVEPFHKHQRYILQQEQQPQKRPMIPDLLDCCIANCDWQLLVYLLETGHQHHSVNNKTSLHVFGKILQSALVQTDLHTGTVLFLSFYPEFLNTNAQLDRKSGTPLQIAATAGKTRLVQFLLNQPGIDMKNVDFDNCKDKNIKKLIKDKQ